MALRRTLADEASMEDATLDFVRAGTLEELRLKGRIVVAATAPSCSYTRADKSSRSTIAVRTWVSRWNEAASRTAFSPAIGIMRASNWRAAARSTYGQMMY